MTYYVIGGDGQRYGPEGIATLQTWVREGRIIHSTTLIEAVTGRTLRAAELPALQMFLAPPGPTEPWPAAPTPGNGGAMPYPRTPGPAGAVQPGPKNKVVAGLLGLFLGCLGIHRFYLGYTGWGMVQLLLTVCTFGLLGWPIAIWGAIEGICCFAGWMNDAQGRPLRD